jgi:hypothetical protein
MAAQFAGVGALLRGRSDSLRWALISLTLINAAPYFIAKKLVENANAALAPAGATEARGVAGTRRSKGAGWVQVEIDGGSFSLSRAHEARLGLTSGTAPVRVLVREGALGSRWVERVEPWTAPR